MWFTLAILSAFFNALCNIARRTHGSLAEPAELAWWTMLLSLPLGLGLLISDNHPLHISWAFVLPALGAAIAGMMAGIQQFTAYKYGDASAISPIANFVPIALLITSFIFLGVRPSVLGLCGVILVVAGVYYSSVSGKHSLFTPLRHLVSHKGSRAMLNWVILISIATTFMQIALRYAAPALVMLFTTLCQLIMLTIYLLIRPINKRVKRGEMVLRRWGWHMAAIAVFGTISVYLQLHAMRLIDASYVLSVKRLDVLFTVLLASLFLRERHILRRFKGSIIALIGVVIIFFAA
jgi:drug/metabolite transporter (DMT)-like permease